MFICQIIASQGNGGLEKHVRELSHRLVELGHRVLVIGDPIFVRTLSAGVESEAINMRFSRHHPWLLFQLYLRLRKYKFDVIHAQANKAASLLGSLQYFIKTPAVVTVHNIKSRFNLFHRFKYVICVSKHLTLQMKSTFVELIYNGIQAPQPKKVNLIEQYQLPLNKPVLCAVGRLVPAKGFDVLLDAIDGLDVSLLVIGEGSQRQELESRIACMKPNTKVCLIGHHERPTDLMASADGLVISSLREGFSYVLNEALLCGTNIVSTDVPAANEVLSSALIVPVNNAMMLREKLIELLQKPSHWTKLMQPSQQFALAELTTTQMTKKTVDLYRRMDNQANEV